MVISFGKARPAATCMVLNTPTGTALIMIDVGMSRTYRGGPAMCLVVEGGKFYAVTETEKTQLPVK